MKNLRLGNKIRKALRGNSKGLTLVEIVIAMALMAIIGVALLGGLSNAMFSLHIADVRTTAESLARSEMEYHKGRGYGAEIDEYSDPPGYEGYYTVRATLTGLADGLEEIELTVIHHERGEIVTLVGYRAKRNV
ncbi:MAG: prepilin-type N-terminal cleavage/methylation domain-containing protein [Dehalococcoidia bacterium]